MKSISAEREGPRLGPDEAARKRVTVEIYARNETTLRHTARRYSLCVDDAEDALQRGLEILLRKAPTDDPRQLIKWMQTVVKHEALAVRRERERTLAGPAAIAPEPGEEDWVALLPADAEGPAEKAERREAVARSREALQTLKPHELRALTLLAEGYSYVEIGEITGFSKTKVNKSLAEGRRRFRALVARSEEGRRCADLQPLLSAFCDGEANFEEAARVREHLRACAHCRSTLRAYRAAPAAAAALSPLPLDRSLWERVQDAVAGLTGRFGGGADPVAQVAGGGAGGAGIAAAAKVAVVCIGTAGAGAACVAGGLVPSPLDLSAERQRPQPLERRFAELPAPAATPQVEYEPAPAKPEQRPERDRSPGRSTARPEPVAVSEPVAESAPATAGEAVEYAPPPEPEPQPGPEPAPEPSSGGGSPAGEFGP